MDHQRSPVTFIPQYPTSDYAHSHSLSNPKASNITSSSISESQKLVHPMVIPSEGPPSVKPTRHKLETTCRRESDLRRFSSNFVPLSTSFQQSETVLHVDTKREEMSGHQHWSSEQPHLPGDLSPNLSELHVTEAARDCGRERRIEVGRSVSEEVMGSHHKDSERDLSIHSHSLSNIPETSQTSTDCSGPGTTKKKAKKGRVVASRYKSVPKNPTNLFRPGNTSALLTSATITTGKTYKSDKLAIKTKSEVKAATCNSSTKKPTQFVRHMQQLASPLPFRPSHKPLSLQFTPSSMTTSTPAHVHHAAHINTVGGTSVSACSLEVNKTLKISSDIGESQTELIFARLLQASYLDITSARSLRLQEDEAKSQAHKLWQCVQEKKDETILLKKMIETEERTLALEKTIEIQLQHLGLVNSKLHTLEQHYSCMAKALDATRHDMVYKRILPCSEGEINAKLGLSEQLLDDITDIIRGKGSIVSSLTDSTKTLLNTFEQLYQESQVCWEELGLLLNIEVRGTSLFFEQEQRKCVL